MMSSALAVRIPLLRSRGLEGEGKGFAALPDLIHRRECEEEGRRAHKHAEELEAYVAQRGEEASK